MPLIKVEAGHYQGPRGTARNITSKSGAPHVRYGTRWLVTLNNGQTELTRSLKAARDLIDPKPMRERLCTPMTPGEASATAATVI